MPAATRSSWMNAWEADLTPSPAARRSEARASAHVRSTRYYTREATARVPQFEETSQQRPPWGAVMVALVFSVLLLGVVIIAPVLINSATTQMESDIGQMQSGQEQLAAETAALSAQISALSAPNRVAEQAGRLGLGPAQSVYYVQTATETAATEGDTTVADR
jgi:cell division protein FtsL